MKAYLDEVEIKVPGAVHFPICRNGQIILEMGKEKLMVYAYIGVDDDGNPAIFCYRKKPKWAKEHKVIR